MLVSLTEDALTDIAAPTPRFLFRLVEIAQPIRAGPFLRRFSRFAPSPFFKYARVATGDDP